MISLHAAALSASSCLPHLLHPVQQNLLAVRGEERTFTKKSDFS